MNSRQRVAAAIARQPVDQVPLGFYVVDYDTIQQVLGRPTLVRNKIEIELALWRGERQRVAESLKRDTVEFYRKIDCADVILPKEAHVLPPRDYEPLGVRELGDDRYQTGDGRIWQAVPEVNELGCVHDPRPVKTEYTVADFEKPLPVKPPDPSCYEAIDYLAAQLGEERYVASQGHSVGIFALGGTENGLMMYALQPEVIHAAARQRVEWQNAADSWCIRPGTSGVLIGQDMGGTGGPLISPEMFRELVLPYFAARVRHLKEMAGQVILHNCGNNLPLMDMFVEAGVDCYQSLQTTAGMEVGRLKALTGGQMCFWGGISVEKLIDGTMEDVRREVRTAMQRGAPGGGFILGPSHSIAKGTKYDNFMALLDEFVKLRDRAW